MNWVDLAIILVIAVFAIEGLKRGLFVQVFDIAGFFTSLIVALLFYSQVASLLVKVFNLPKIAANPVGFLVVWLIIESLFFLFLSGIFKKILSKFQANFLNQYFGFAPAAINSLLFLAFLLMFIVSLPVKPEIKRDVFDSKIGSYLVTKAAVFEKPINSIFGPIAKQSLTFLTVKPEEKGSIPLEFTQSTQSVDFQSERQMFELVNKERLLSGAKPLTWDESLSKVARGHSEDMFKRGYFSHFSPEGKDVGDRLLENGIEYSYAGENLALAPNVVRAHTGLINSEGHRRNILDPAFSKIGIGAIDGDIYGKMFTQVFTN